MHRRGGGGPGGGGFDVRASLGTLAGGAAGFFVGKRICIQPTTW